MKEVQIYELEGTNLLYVVSDKNLNATYYDKSNLTVEAVDGYFVLYNLGVIVLRELPREFVNPIESSVVDLVEIIEGYIGNIIPSNIAELTALADILSAQEDSNELLEAIDLKAKELNDVTSPLIDEDFLIPQLELLAQLISRYTKRPLESGDNIIGLTKLYPLEASLGRIPGVGTVNKFGAAPDGIQLTTTDIWSRADATPTQSIWLAPTASRQHTIASDNVADTTGGTGVDTVIISYLPNWYTKERMEIVVGDLNAGILMDNSAVMINRMKVVPQATTTPQNNVGTITATAAVDATITANILPLKGQTQAAIFGIPSTQTFCLTNYNVVLHDTTGSKITGFLVVNENPTVQTINFIVKDNTGAIDVGSSNGLQNFDPYYEIEGPAIIKLQAIGSKADLDCTATWDGYVVDKIY